MVLHSFVFLISHMYFDWFGKWSNHFWETEATLETLYQFMTPPVGFLFLLHYNINEWHVLIMLNVWVMICWTKPLIHFKCKLYEKVKGKLTLSEAPIVHTYASSSLFLIIFDLKLPFIHGVQHEIYSILFFSLFSREQRKHWSYERYTKTQLESYWFTRKLWQPVT